MDQVLQKRKVLPGKFKKHQKDGGQETPGSAEGEIAQGKFPGVQFEKIALMSWRRVSEIAGFDLETS